MKKLIDKVYDVITDNIMNIGLLYQNPQPADIVEPIEAYHAFVTTYFDPYISKKEALCNVYDPTIAKCIKQYKYDFSKEFLTFYTDLLNEELIEYFQCFFTTPIYQHLYQNKIICPLTIIQWLDNVLHHREHFALDETFQKKHKWYITHDNVEIHSDWIPSNAKELRSEWKPFVESARYQIKEPYLCVGAPVLKKNPEICAQCEQNIHTLISVQEESGAMKEQHLCQCSPILWSKIPIPKTMLHEFKLTCCYRWLLAIFSQEAQKAYKLKKFTFKEVLQTNNLDEYFSTQLITTLSQNLYQIL